MLIKDCVYGQWELSDPLAVKITELPAWQRLRNVNQYGPHGLVFPEFNTTRAEHSLGVYYLLRHFGAGREEQIAGLLHDISHTVFSHVIDFVYGDVIEQTTQDKAHLKVLSQEDIKNILAAAQLDYKRIARQQDYLLLDREFPDLCCDRLDYLLRDSVCLEEITIGEVRGILSRLTVVAGHITIKDGDVARFLLKLSLAMTKKWWCSPWGCFLYDRAAAAIRPGLALGLIDDNDLYTTDRVVWDKLKTAPDAEIQQAIFDVENIKQMKLCLDESDYDYHLNSKFRAVDPLVSDGARLRRATEIFPELGELLSKERARFAKGYYVKVVR